MARTVTIIAFVLLVGPVRSQLASFCYALGYNGCGTSSQNLLPPCFFDAPGYPPTIHTPPGVPVLYNSCVPVFASLSPSEPCQRNDNASTIAIPFGFAFTLFGQTYTQAFVNNNGNITFNAPVAQGTPTSLGTPGLPPMIAPFWADVDTRIINPLDVAGVVRVGDTGLPGIAPSFVVTWNRVGRFPQQTDKLNTFQVVLTDSFYSPLPLVPNGGGRHYNVAFLYNDMQWTTGDASGGQSGFGGTGALVGASLNDQVPSHTRFIGQFSQPGRFLTGGGVDWLDWRTIYMDLAVDPPIVEIRPQIPSALLIYGLTPALDSVSPTDRLLVTPVSTLAASALPLTGGASEYFPIPGDPAVLGSIVFLQVGFFDPHQFPQDPLQLSNGLSVSFGVGALAYGQGGSPLNITLSHVPSLGSQVRIYYTHPEL